MDTSSVSPGLCDEGVGTVDVPTLQGGHASANGRRSSISLTLKPKHRASIDEIELEKQGKRGKARLLQAEGETAAASAKLCRRKTLHSPSSNRIARSVKGMPLDSCETVQNGASGAFAHQLIHRRYHNRTGLAFTSGPTSAI
jgi:hypothetical protein